MLKGCFYYESLKILSGKAIELFVWVCVWVYVGVCVGVGVSVCVYQF